MAEKEKPKKKSGRKTLTENQDQFCKLIATQGMKPMDAMLEIFPNRKSYAIQNQQRLLKEMINNPKIQARLEELYKELRNNEVLGDLYNFDKGAKLLINNIERANKRVEDGEPFTESIHRIILTSVQELNRMYGFNIVDRNGNTGGTMNVTFIKVDQTEGDVKIG